MFKRGVEILVYVWFYGEKKLFLSELIMIKIGLKLKWFMFGNIYVKVGLTISLIVKVNSRMRSYNFYLIVESILRENQHWLLQNQNQTYTYDFVISDY